MTMLADFRAQYPQYDDMPDAALADSLHAKFYADIPRADFDVQLGMGSAPAAQPEIPADGSPQSMEAYLKASEPAPGVLEDVAKTVPSGLARGVPGLVGLPGDIGYGMRWLNDKAMQGLGIREHDEGYVERGRSDDAPETWVSRNMPNLDFRSKDVVDKIEGAVGPLYHPKTTAGKYANTVAEFAPGVVTGPANIVRNVTTQAVIPAIVSETAGQMTEGTAMEPWARVLGALGGGVVSAPYSKLPGAVEKAAAKGHLAEEAALPQVEGAPQVSATPEPAASPTIQPEAPIAAQAAPEAAQGEIPFFNADGSVTMKAVPEATPAPQAAEMPALGPNTAQRAELPSYLSREFESVAPTKADIVAASERQNIPVSRAVASDSHLTKRVGGFLSDTMFIGTPLERAANETRDALKSATMSVLKAFGSGERFNSGEAASTAIREWMANGSKETVGELYKKVATLFDKKATSDMSRTRQVAQELRNQIDESTSQVNQRVLDLIEEAVTKPGGLTYDGLTQLRQDIGARFDGSMIPEPGTPIPALKRVYGAMSEDLHKLVYQSGGQRALSSYMKAERVNQLTAAKREELSALVGGTKDAAVAPEKVAERILGWASSKSAGDVRSLLEARKIAGPEAFDQLASYAISKMGFEANGSFSPAQFFTQYANMTENGRRVLFGSTGKADLKQSIDDIAAIASRAKDLDKYGNPSRTFSVGSGLGVVMGTIFHPLTTLSTGAGGYMVARALSKPATAKQVSRWASARERIMKDRSEGARLQYVLMSKNLAAALSKETGDDEDGIANHLINEGSR